MNQMRLENSPRHRGMIFVTALGIIIILTGLVLVFAQSMRTENLASANRRSDANADAVEHGAEQWVQAQVDAYTTDAMTITQVPAEAIQVGSGYFWILQPNPDSDQDYLYGITDESSKLNINSATATQLINLPCVMQQEVADAITDWRNPAARATADGAESNYYESLTEPYACKNGPYETVEELLLVEGVTPQLLWGYDFNRNGILEDAEKNTGGSNVGSFTGGGGGDDGRGIFNYLTCYSTQPPPPPARSTSTPPRTLFSSHSGCRRAMPSRSFPSVRARTTQTRPGPIPSPPNMEPSPRCSPASHRNIPPTSSPSAATAAPSNASASSSM